MTILGHLEQHPGLDPPAFKSTVIHVDETHLELDRTQFYPMGGGQPADKGNIASESFHCDVVDVRKSGAIHHHIESAVGDLRPGDEVTCEIDSLWRNQLCKMHTAQHLVSALANEEWGADTVGNQIGRDRTRIDLFFDNRDVFNREHLQELVNEAIAQNLEVKMDFRHPSDLIDDPLVRINMDRMPPNIDVWRTISIGQLDVCPCAGTHVPSTSHIPPVEITRVKSKGAGRLRVEYIFNE